MDPERPLIKVLLMAASGRKSPFLFENFTLRLAIANLKSHSLR
jgi:hypothetical protein